MQEGPLDVSLSWARSVHRAHDYEMFQRLEATLPTAMERPSLMVTHLPE
jgi:hypothetical protein